jgi:steroid delta-isomerase-like uncharacterized protein
VNGAESTKEQSMPTSQLDTVRRFVDEFQSGHDIEVARQLIANDCIDRTPIAPFTPDREGVLDLFAMLFTAFPDLRVEIHDLIEAGDKVVTRKTFHGTHEGDFMGVAATGRAVSWDVIDIVRLRDGQMVEHWNSVDALGLLTQLGALPFSPEEILGSAQHAHRTDGDVDHSA